MSMPDIRKKKKGDKEKSVRDVVCMDENIFDEKGRLKSKHKKPKTNDPHDRSFPRTPVNFK